MGDVSELRRPWRHMLYFAAAFLMTLWAAMLNTVTFATNDYTRIGLEAIACAAGATVLLVLAWPRMGWPGRLGVGLLAAINVWTLLDAGGRRLPAILGR